MQQQADKYRSRTNRTCLWQACPELTAKEVIELVRRSGDRKDYPDNIYGYGVPDMWKAYQDYLLKR